MNDKPKLPKDLKVEDIKLKLPPGWVQLELPMPDGHTRVITQKRPPDAKKA